MSIKENIIKLLGGINYSDYNTEVVGLKTEIDYQKNRCNEQLNKFTELETKHKTLILESTKLNNQVNTLQTQLRRGIISEIDEALIKNKFTLISNKAYTQKRKAKNKPITIYLNQLITPTTYEVIKKRLELNSYFTPNFEEYVKRIGNIVSKDFTWTDDKNLDQSGDYYLYPEELIVTKKGDCEDHAFCVASLSPEEIGVVYGFYYPLGKTAPFNKYGHAWNIVVIDEKLYHMETTGDSCELIPFENQNNYEPYFVVTQKRTFEIKKGMEFGYLAEVLNDETTKVGTYLKIQNSTSTGL